MLDVGTSFLIQFTEATLHKNAICSATLRDTIDGLFTAELWEEDADIETGQEFIAYYDIDGIFVKQFARIEMTLPSDTTSLISFRLLDTPKTADKREDYRIAIQDYNLTADICNETNCPLIDVSNFSFAVHATGKYALASIVTVVLQFKGTRYLGKATVESVTDLPDGRIRYGFRYVDNSRASVSLKTGIQLIKLTLDQNEDLPATGTI